MWYVSGISLVRFDGVEIQEFCLEITQTILDNSDVYVFLRNTEDSREECLVDTVADAELFKRELDRYNPYGCVQINSWQYPYKFATSDRIMLIEVDEFSIQFLEYIDSIRPVARGVDKRLDLFLCERADGIMFRFWDRECTLLEFVESTCQFAGTLFHAVRMLSSSWRDDVLYVRAGFVDYGIYFNDIVKARSLISKAALLGVKNNLEEAYKRLPDLPF